jgi:hypothetical protein
VVVNSPSRIIHSHHTLDCVTSTTSEEKLREDLKIKIRRGATYNERDLIESPGFENGNNTGDSHRPNNARDFEYPFPLSRGKPTAHNHELSRCFTLRHPEFINRTESDVRLAFDHRESLQVKSWFRTNCVFGLAASRG